MARRLISRKQVAEMLGCDPSTVGRNHLTWGLNPVRISPRIIRYDVAEVEAYIRKMTFGVGA